MISTMKKEIGTLRDFLRPYTTDGIALAFSGGVDSSLLLAVLADMRREKEFPLLALFMHSCFQSPAEAETVRAGAAALGAELEILSFDPLALPEVRFNPPDRCYHCKKHIFTRFREVAAARKLRHLFDGSHAGDARTYRPGRRALAELGVASPLAELGFDKPVIRAMARELGLDCAGKPAAPCLATRFDYGEELTPEKIAVAALGEKTLRQYLPPDADLRLRIHGTLGRIEVPPENFPALMAHREEIVDELRTLGLRFVALDLAGFRSGSFDAGGRPQEKRKSGLA